MIPGAWGIFRWISWFFKRIVASRHKDRIHKISNASVSVIIPIFQEKPESLRRCILSIKRHALTEIIAVIQEPLNDTFHQCISTLREFPEIKAIITDQLGKRIAMVIGANASIGEISCFVDSDVIWGEDNNLQTIIAQFNNPKVGAVSVSTRASETRTYHAKLQDTLWNMRNNTIEPFLSSFAKGVDCITGRTAFYRKPIIQKAKRYFLNEKFLGKTLDSGDDKCLTRQTYEQGYNTIFIKSFVVYSEIPDSISVWLKQNLRWYRNGARSDGLSLLSRTMWKNKTKMNLFILDRLCGKVSLIIGTITSTIAVIVLAHSFGYLVALSALLSILFWWIATRGVKAFWGADVHSIPVLVLYAYFMPILAIISLYGSLTLFNTKWMTR